MLPLSVLNTATGHNMLVELKNGETYNGRLVSCDNRMNLNLAQVVCTSKDGDRFWQMPECFVKGNSIKFLRVPPEIVDMVKEEPPSRMKNRQGRGGRGRGGGRGSGRGAGGGGRGGHGGGGRGGPAGGGRGGRGGGGGGSGARRRQ